MPLMQLADLEKALSTLIGTTIEVSDSGEPAEAGEAPVRLLFSDGSMLHAHYWRIIEPNRPLRSCFDHGQKYGLRLHIDAIEELKQSLRGRSTEWARFDRKSGDLVFAFQRGIEFQAFNFTGYEDWEIRFADGTGEYSNYAIGRRDPNSPGGTIA